MSGLGQKPKSLERQFTATCAASAYEPVDIADFAQISLLETKSGIEFAAFCIASAPTCV